MKQDKNISAEEIKKFVEKTSKDRFSHFTNDSKIVEIKNLLEKAEKNEENEFTFTVGNLNAYLG